MGRTIFELLDGYRSGQLYPNKVVEEFLNKAHSKDKWNVFTITTDKLSYQNLCNISDKTNLPLYGIPIGVKDSIDIEGYITSNGASVKGLEVSEKSAELVNRFIERGAVVVGKNNLYNFSSGVTSTNDIHGDVVNPLNRNITAGGSSGGSAAAVSSGLVPLSIGADTSGSVRIPAACCGVVGLKLSYQPELHVGFTPLSKTLDHIGFFTKDVRDMEIMYSSIFEESNDEDSEIIKIGIPNAYFNENIDEEINQMIDYVIDKFKSVHCKIISIDMTFLKNIDFIKASRDIGTPEFAFLHHENVNRNPNIYSEDLKSIFKKGKTLSSFEYLYALKEKEYIKDKINILFNDVDIILTPTMPIVPPSICTNVVMDAEREMSVGDAMIKYTSIFNLSGHPAISIPSAYINDGISLGFQMVADTENTKLLFKVGRLYEFIRDK